MTRDELTCIEGDADGPAEEDKEGVAMLQQASRLMKQVLLKGSPRSVSDTDTGGMFMDSGDDDSSQLRSRPVGRVGDMPTPTASDEPSDGVHLHAKHEQVVPAPIVQMVPSEMQFSKGSRPLVTPMPPDPLDPRPRPVLPFSAPPHFFSFPCI